MPFSDVNPKTWSTLVTRIFIVLACVFALTTTLLQVYNTAQIRKTQVDGTPTGKAILSCTSPTGKCFKRGQANLAFAIKSVNEVSIYAATCASNLPRPSVDEIEKCVKTYYAKNHNGDTLP